MNERDTIIPTIFSLWLAVIKFSIREQKRRCVKSYFRFFENQNLNLIWTGLVDIFTQRELQIIKRKREE